MRPGRKFLAAAGGAGAAAAAWSLFESQWVEFNEVTVPIERLPDELDGFRILHLSDFHLGTRSLNARSVDKAVAWAMSRCQAPRHGRTGQREAGNLDRTQRAGKTLHRRAGPETAARDMSRGQAPGHDPENEASAPEFDLVAITGDLLSRRRGEPALRRALAGLRASYGVYAVLGNHDLAETRDPFAEASGVSELPGAVLLSDSARTFEARGIRVHVAGLAPDSFMRREPSFRGLFDAEAGLRVLLCHFPDVVGSLPAGAFDLILAGHLHGGQICLPSPWGKLHLQRLRAMYREGLFETRAGALHVSRGLGTSFVPFRFLARPEATALTLRAN